MKQILAIALCFFSITCYSQSLKFYSDLGYSTTELYQDKRFSLYNGFGFGYSINISNNWQLEFLPNTYSLKYSRTNSMGENTFNTLRFIGFTIDAKKYFPLTARTKLYFAFGLTANHLWRNKVENKTLSTETLGKNLGFGYGISSSIGIRIPIAQTVMFDIGLSDSEDLFTSYKDVRDKVKSARRGLRTGFYFQLNQSRRAIPNVINFPN